GGGGDHLHHRVPRAGAQVDGHAALDPVHGVEGGQVAEGQVDDVEVVTHAGAVAGGVVVAEHPHERVAARGHLHDVRHEVVGDALGVLAHAPAGVGAHRVEVAQRQHLPAVVAGRQVGQHVLDDQLG